MLTFSQWNQSSELGIGQNYRNCLKITNDDSLNTYFSLATAT